MNQLLKLADFSVSFATPRGNLHAVRGVDLVVAKGESIGIVGESGSGKTVLSRATMGLMPSTATCTGLVEFNGVPLSNLSRAEVRNYWGTGMAMIFQDPLTSLNPVRRIGSQLMEGLIVRLGMPKNKPKPVQ